MNYKKLIKNWLRDRTDITTHNFMPYLVDLFNYLYKNNLKKEDLTPELVNEILIGFQIKGLLDAFQIRYQNILLFYLKHLSKTLLKTGNQPNKDCISDNDCEIDPSILINIDINSLPDKKLDLEYMKKLGLEND